MLDAARSYESGITQEKQAVAVKGAGKKYKVMAADAAPAQLSLSLDRWPVPTVCGVYDRDCAHRQAFEQRCGGGRICISLWVLEVVPDLYIQSCEVVLGEISRSTQLKLTRRNRFDSPEAALLAAVTRATRELKTNKRASGLYPEYQSALLRAANWLDDLMQQCDYLLERQVNLFS